MEAVNEIEQQIEKCIKCSWSIEETCVGWETAQEASLLCCLYFAALQEMRNENEME